MAKDNETADVGSSLLHEDVWTARERLRAHASTTCGCAEGISGFAIRGSSPGARLRTRVTEAVDSSAGKTLRGSDGIGPQTLKETATVGRDHVGHASRTTEAKYGATSDSRSACARRMRKFRLGQPRISRTSSITISASSAPRGRHVRTNSTTHHDIAAFDQCSHHQGNFVTPIVSAARGRIKRYEPADCVR